MDVSIALWISPLWIFPQVIDIQYSLGHQDVLILIMPLKNSLPNRSMQKA